MQGWIRCPLFHWIRVWMTHVPSSKIPKRDSRSRVSKTGVNLHKIEGIRLDDTSKCKDLCMNMQASMQRCKESKRAKQAAQIKQGKHIITWSGKRVSIKQTDITRMCSHKWLDPNKPQVGQMQPNTSKWPQRPTSPSPRRAPNMEKTRSRLTNVDIKHKSKQAYTCIKEIIQTLYYRHRCKDVGLNHKIQMYIISKGQSTRKRHNKRGKGKAKHQTQQATCRYRHMNMAMSTSTYRSKHKHSKERINKQI